MTEKTQIVVGNFSGFIPTSLLPYFEPAKLLELATSIQKEDPIDAIKAVVSLLQEAQKVKFDFNVLKS